MQGAADGDPPIVDGTWNTPDTNPVTLTGLEVNTAFTAFFFDPADKRTPKVACGTIDFTTDNLVRLAPLTPLLTPFFIRLA